MIVEENKSSRGQPKKHAVPYKGDAVELTTSFNDYLDCVADCFRISFDDREEEPRLGSAPSIRDVCNEFNISIPKCRKLLITAGMYSSTHENTDFHRGVAVRNCSGSAVYL